MAALTDRFLKSVHGKEHPKIIEKSDGDGLAARISRKGKVVFQIRYRFSGKPQRMDIGIYPSMSLTEAREESGECFKALRRGIDPKTLQNSMKPSEITVKELFNRWYESICSKQKKSHKEILRSFEIHVFPYVGNSQHDILSVQDWILIIERTKEKAVMIADRVLTNMKQCSEWGIATGLIKEMPLSTINARKHLSISRNRESGRSLTDDEVSLILRSNDLCRMSPKSKLFVELVFLTGCRPGELIGALRTEFDFDNHLWEIPYTRHKTGLKTKKPLKRPLTPYMEVLFKRAFDISLSSTMLFTNDTEDKPLNSRSVLSYSRNITNYCNRTLKKDLELFSLTDVRKTVRTNMSSITDPHIAEKILGHSFGGVWAVYDRYDYLPEMLKAYQNWNDRLEIIKGLSNRA